MTRFITLKKQEICLLHMLLILVKTSYLNQIYWGKDIHQ